MIAGIVLAAGTSSRLGRPKQLLVHRGRPLVQHAVDAAVGAGLDEVVVVLGHEAETVQDALELPPGGRVVVNPDYANGQSTSLRAGLAALEDDARAAVVLLSDQPGVGAGEVRAAVERYEETGGPVVRASWRGRPGHPVVFDRSVWGALAAVSGDVGARDLLRERPDWVVTLPFDRPPPPDVDTEADYERLRADD